MNDVTPPMSLSYRVVFAFSIFMMLLALLGGSKSGIGILLWGYTAWLMFKRNNLQLVVTFKALLWFEVAVGGIGLVVLAFYSDDVQSLTVYVALILLAIAISYGMLQFFTAQAEQGNNSISSDASISSQQTPSTEIQPKIDSEKLWAKALGEYNSADRNEGLWAKCFASCDGDENKTKAEYLKARVSQLERSEITKISHEPTRTEIKEAIQKPSVGGNFREASYVTHKRHAQKNINLLALFGGIFAIIILTIVLTYSPKSKTSGSYKNITSADTAQELMGLIKDNKINPIDISIQSAGGLTEISSYPWNAYRARLNQSEVATMESQNRWWIYKGKFYIRIYNPHNTPLMGFAISMRDGLCEATNQQTKKYMYFDMGSNPLKEYDTQIYVADLSPEYSNLAERKVKHCGDVEAAWAMR